MSDSNGNKIRGTFSYGVIRAIGDHLFFSRNTKEIWASGGTPATTKKLVDFGTRRIVGAGGVTYLTWDDGGSVPPSSFLWTTDGTPAGTQPLKYSDGSSVEPSFLTPLGANLFFWSSDYRGSDQPTHPGGLSITDGTPDGTTALEVYAYPIEASNFLTPRPPATIDSVVYFGAQTYDGEGNFSDPALWRSDGTTDGTYAVGPGYASQKLDNVTAAGGKIFFSTQAGKGTELWAYAP